MFKNKDDAYLEATRYAQVNIEANAKSSNMKLVIFNFVVVTLLAIITFFYLKSKAVVLLDEPTTNRAVLGVSLTVDDAEGLALRNSMKVLMNESSIQSQSSYTKALGRELDNSRTDY